MSERPPSLLPGNTETNPKEHVKVLTLRSGRELQPKVQEEKEKINELIKEQPTSKDKGKPMESSAEEKSSSS